jgi:glyoxylase-like metal-dependent hydrolase (beta-lactamase superfamily II)
VSTASPTVVLAPNPSALTGAGTNTYLCADAGAVLCIDPGPDDRRHLAAILAAAEPLGAISTVLLSHSHPDHRPLARALAAQTGALIRCMEPARADDGALPLRDGERVHAGELTLEAVATPGHAADHLCFWDADSRILYSGDHILEGMTTVIAPPDGDMSEYMASLERVKRLRPATILPGHGVRVDDAAALIDEYLVHRREREAEVLSAARERGAPVTPVELVPAIYAQYPKELWPYAAMSVRAHLDKLVKEGRARLVAGADGSRYRVT